MSDVVFTIVGEEQVFSVLQLAPNGSIEKIVACRTHNGDDENAMIGFRDPENFLGIFHPEIGDRMIGIGCVNSDSIIVKNATLDVEYPRTGHTVSIAGAFDWSFTIRDVNGSHRMCVVMEGTGDFLKLIWNP